MTPTLTFSFEVHCLEHVLFEHIHSFVLMDKALFSKLSPRAQALLGLASGPQQHVNRLLACEVLLNEVDDSGLAADWRAWFRPMAEAIECPSLRQAFAGMRSNALHLGLDGPFPTELWRAHVLTAVAGMERESGVGKRRRSS
jgi:hypothetical protein